MDKPSNSNNDKPCPLGSDSCPIYEQIAQLQQQVARLSEAVSTDHLTGLFNRQHLMVCLEQELERTRRSQAATTLILLDIDYFKRFNDNYGHVLGDKVLTHLARCMRQSIRRLDIPCRYGGEEFAVILPSSSIATGALVAERMRAYVENNALVHEEQMLKITISLGIAEFYNEAAGSVEKLINAADKQLYAAKQSGRNCVKYIKRELKNSQVSAEEKAALFNFEKPPRHN